VERERRQVGTWDGRHYHWVGELDVDVGKDAAEQLLYELKDVVRGGWVVGELAKITGSRNEDGGDSFSLEGTSTVVVGQGGFNGT